MPSRPTRLRAALLAVLLVAAVAGCSSDDPLEYSSKALENFKTACTTQNEQGGDQALTGDALVAYCGQPDQNDNTLTVDRAKDGCVLAGLRERYPEYNDFKDFENAMKDFLKSGDKTREDMAANPELKDFVTITDGCTTKGP